MDRRTVLQSVGGAALAGFLPAPTIASSTRQAIGYLRTNWSRDPFSFGAYSFIAKGARKRQVRDLAAPIENRLFFAGEATHPDYNSTVHAAYESGLIAAEAVKETEAQTVAVIGAGMSGLAAASDLRSSGKSVSVFEARPRIGGRIWTDGSLGLPLDLGASWMHGEDGNPLNDLINAVGMASKLTADSNVVRGGDGREIEWDDAPDWLEEVVSVQHSAGASLSELNTRAYWVDLDYGGGDRLFPSGYAQIFDALTDGLSVRFNTVVREVALTDDQVSLRDDTGDLGSFDAVIVTVPLGVLKHGSMTFTPNLPKAKQAAIAALGFGVLDKVYLQFDDVFWDAEAWLITPENDLPVGQFNQWLNLFPYIGEPVLVAFNGAQPARDLAALPDEELVRRALQTLSMAYPSV